jgi:hypothetical protein
MFISAKILKFLTYLRNFINYFLPSLQDYADIIIYNIQSKVKSLSALKYFSIYFISFKNCSRIGIKFIKLLWTGDFNLNIYIWFERV